MTMLNPFKFELTSLYLTYCGPKRGVPTQSLKNIMLFGEMHCSRLKKLDIRNDLHSQEFMAQEFPLKNYLRPDSSDEIFIIKRDCPIYLNRWSCKVNLQKMLNWNWFVYLLNSILPVIRIWYNWNWLLKRIKQ